MIDLLGTLFGLLATGIFAFYALTYLLVKAWPYIYPQDYSSIVRRNRDQELFITSSPSDEEQLESGKRISLREPSYYLRAIVKRPYWFGYNTTSIIWETDNPNEFSRVTGNIDWAKATRFQYESFKC